MPQFVDGFVLPISKKNVARYKTIASKAAKVWREHGALEYRECVLADGDAHGLTTFPALAKASRTETVVFAWITYKSRAHRDRVNKLVMQDERMHSMMGMAGMPFDLQRMACGGFTVLVAR